MSLQIIDTHQHLWELEKLSLPWVNEIPQLNRNFTLENYREYTRPDQDSQLEYSIEKTIYLEVDVADSDVQSETELILQWCRDDSTPLVGMVASARPGTPKFRQSLEFAKGNREIRGFRRVLHTDATPQGFCLEKDFVDSVRTMGKNSLTFDLCIRRQELADVVELANECPHTQFVLDHCGNADASMSPDEFLEWQKNIQAISKCENVACKVSGFVWTIQNSNWSYETAIEPILRVVFESFGEDRIMFGGDWPVCTLSCLTFSQWVNAIHRFAKSFGSGTAERLFCTNAEKIYGLE